jgi:hypothetical protein
VSRDSKAVAVVGTRWDSNGDWGTTVLQCQMEFGTSQRLSDHRPVIVDFAWTPER